MKQLVLALSALALLATAIPAKAGSCTTNCYGSGSYRTCTTNCY